jgi:tetratricopeptide (TPR) repeat protein
MKPFLFRKPVRNPLKKNRSGFPALISFFVSFVFLTSLVAATLLYADPLGEQIFQNIVQGNKKYTDASLMLMTRDLKWYEQNMAKLPANVRKRVEEVRINLAAEAATNAARELKEPKSVFGATGSWNPGRDADIIYFGKDTDTAKDLVNKNYEQATAKLLAGQGEFDPILQSIKQKGDIPIPKSLSTETMSIVVSDLPDFGYKDLENAYLNAKKALAKGKPNREIIQDICAQVKASLAQNFEAHIASTAPDMYRGAAGQAWFKGEYLRNPERMRTFEFNPNTGQWVLKEGGFNAVPKVILDRAGFGSFKGGKVKFSIVASNLSLFVRHKDKGLSDTAKYAVRMLDEVDLDILKNIPDEDIKSISVANRITSDPQNAAKYLQQAGMTEEGLQKGLSKILSGWTKDQLLGDTQKLVEELAALRLTPTVLEAGGDMENILAKMSLKFDLNELASGLQALDVLPPEMKNELIDTLKKQFAHTDAGQIAINYIMKQMKLLGDEGGYITKSILTILKQMGQATDDEVEIVLKALAEKKEIPGRIGTKIRTARKEIMLLSCASMIDFDTDAQALDRLIEAWRKQNPGALIQSPSKEVKTLVQHPKNLSPEQLKRMGFNEDERTVAKEMKKRLLGPSEMKRLEGKLGQRLASKGINLTQFKDKLREVLFNPAYVKLGDPSISVGAFDAFFGAATGLYMTYDILFNRGLTPELENLELGNAWVTAIPVVGDFAQGLITLGQAIYEGDGGKYLESGLWLAIGVMGCVPGGQLPALVAGIALGSKAVFSGVYDAKQAQNLIQAWVESGDWTKDKPAKLSALLDRNNGKHGISYGDLLTEKGDVYYKSERIKSLFFKEITINDSIREYAEQYIFPQYPALSSLREALKSLYPDFNDKEWANEALAGKKIDQRGGKGGKMLFKSYERVRRQALDQTLGHLKTWAEDERRAARDYNEETERLKEELRRLDSELKAGTLLKHAEDSVEAYSKIIKNAWEQESLPLAKLRTYEYYTKTYRTIAGQLRRVNDLFREVSSPYIPQSWHLTGYPVFDTGRITDLLTSMESGRKGVIERTEKLLKELDLSPGRFDPNNECHKKAFESLVPLRYRIAFIENLITYYKQLAETSNTWTASYESARKNYESQVKDVLKGYTGKLSQIGEQKTVADAFQTFLFAVPYNLALAAKEVALYRSTAADFEINKVKALSDYDLAVQTYGSAGKALSACLNPDLEIAIQLSDKTPALNDPFTAKAVLLKGKQPKDTFWVWKTEGGLSLTAEKTDTAQLKAAAGGVLKLFLFGYGLAGKEKIFAQTMLTITPTPKKDPEIPTKVTRIENEMTEAFKAKDWKKLLDIRSQASKRVNVPADRVRIILDETAKMLRALAQEKLNFLTNYKSYLGKLVNVNKKTMEEVKDEIRKNQFETTYNENPERLPFKPPCTAQRYSQPEDLRRCENDAFNVAEGVNNDSKCIAGLYELYVKYKKELEQTAGKINEATPYRYNAEYLGSNNFKDWFEDVDKLQKELKIPDKMPEVVKVSWEYQSPCKFKTEAKKPELKMAQLKVELSVKGGKTNLKINETAEITANVSGGTAPYKFIWSGAGGSAGRAAFSSVRGGSFTVSVTVTDEEGAKALASQIFKVGAATARIEGLTKGVYYGSTLALTALPNEKGPLFVLWQSSPSITFNPQQSPGATKATFNSMGDNRKTIKIWAVIQRETGKGVYETIGESEAEEVTVAAPKFTLVLKPDKGLVGQETRATIISNPPIPSNLVNYLWLNPAKSLLMPYDQNQSVIGYVPRDGKPVEFQVMARVPGSGEPIADNIKAVLNSRQYSVKALVTGIAETQRPKIWKENVGVVTLDKGVYAADEHVRLNAEVEGYPNPSEILWTWTANAGTTLISPMSKEPAAYRSETGNAELTVVAKNKDGIELGRASASFPVSVSRETIRISAQKGSAMEKLSQAKKVVKKGQLDEAVALSEEAVKLFPANKEALSYAQKLKGEKDQVLSQIDKAKRLSAEKRYPEALQELRAAKNLHSQYKPVIEAERSIYQEKEKLESGAKEALGKIYVLLYDCAFEEALGEIEKENQKFKDDPYWRFMISSYKNQINMKLPEKRKKISTFQEGEKKFKEYDFEGVLQVMTMQNTAGLFGNRDRDILNRAYQIINDAGEKVRKLREWNPQLHDLVEEVKQKKTTPQHIELGLTVADQILSLQPNNAKVKQDKAFLQAALGSQKEAKAKEAQAQKLRNEGADLQRANKLPEALSKYKESLHYFPDPKLEEHMRKLESQIAADQKNRQAADKLWEEGRTLYGQGKHTEALRAFKESLKALPDAQRSSYVTQLEQQLTQKKAQCQSLRDEGARHQASAKLPEALAKYKEYLKLCPDPQMENHVKQLEAALAEQQKKVQQAQQFRAQGEAFQKQNKIPEAIADYREYIKLVPNDQAVARTITELEALLKDQQQKMQQAQQFRAQGEAFQKQNKIPEAIAAYREYIKLVPNDQAVARTITELEARQKDLQQKAQYAQQLRAQGEAFQKQGRIPEAIAKYKEVLSYQPNDEALKNHIRNLEANLAVTTTTKPSPPQGAGGSLPSGIPCNLTGTWIAQLTKETQWKMILRQQGNKVTGIHEVNIDAGPGHENLNKKTKDTVEFFVCGNRLGKEPRCTDPNFEAIIGADCNSITVRSREDGKKTSGSWVWKRMK